MPQLDTSTFTSQLFWLIVCFFSMLFIMSRFIVPRIADILEQRQRKIDGYLNKAHNIRAGSRRVAEKISGRPGRSNCRSQQVAGRYSG